MATTQSPMRVASESPQRVDGSGFAASTFSSARSVSLSLPTIVAFSEVPSASTTSTSSASAITW